MVLTLLTITRDDSDVELLWFVLKQTLVTPATLMTEYEMCAWHLSSGELRMQNDMMKRVEGRGEGEG